MIRCSICAAVIARAVSTPNEPGCAAGLRVDPTQWRLCLQDLGNGKAVWLRCEIHAAEDGPPARLGWQKRAWSAVPGAASCGKGVRVPGYEMIGRLAVNHLHIKVAGDLARAGS